MRTGLLPQCAHWNPRQYRHVGKRGGGGAKQQVRTIKLSAVQGPRRRPPSVTGNGFTTLPSSPAAVSGTLRNTLARLGPRLGGRCFPEVLARATRRYSQHRPVRPDHPTGETSFKSPSRCMSWIMPGIFYRVVEVSGNTTMGTFTSPSPDRRSHGHGQQWQSRGDLTTTVKTVYPDAPTAGITGRSAGATSS